MVAVDLRASALAVLAWVGADIEDPHALALDASATAASSSSVIVIPHETQPQVNLDAVWWTAPRSEPIGRLGERWGVGRDRLTELNPTLEGTHVAAGQRLLIYRHVEGEISRSVGAPNRGRLENAVPFPEGEGWRLRTFRPRSFATRQVVSELARTLSRWRERHPNAAPIKLGEFSKRGGGRVAPHASHRTGRDVDIGYVMLVDDDGHRFTRATQTNLDGAATWGFVHALLQSNSVESIFMSARVQRLLVPFAAAELPPEQLQRHFSVLAPDGRTAAKATLKPWRGHDDHMHVRFNCTEADVGCKDAYRRKRKRRRKKSRRRRRR